MTKRQLSPSYRDGGPLLAAAHTPPLDITATGIQFVFNGEAAGRSTAAAGLPVVRLAAQRPVRLVRVMSGGDSEGPVRSASAGVACAGLPAEPQSVASTGIDYRLCDTRTRHLARRRGRPRVALAVCHSLSASGTGIGTVP